MWSLNPPGVGVVQEQEKNKEEEQQKYKHDVAYTVAHCDAHTYREIRVKT